MTTNFPSSVDAFTNPTSADTLDNPPHDQQHADINDAMEAVQTALLDGSPLKIDDANNRVGIGTTSPDTELHIAANSGAKIRIESTDTSLAADESIGAIEWEAQDSSTGSSGVVGKIDYLAKDVSPDYAMTFHTMKNNSGTPDFSERMRIDENGNIGINDTTPSYTLDVNGDINATGDLRIGGTAIGAWTSFTPSWTNFTVGNATQDWKYAKVNNMLFITGFTTLGSTSSMGSNPYFTFPTGYATTRANGSASFEDTGNAERQGMCFVFDGFNRLQFGAYFVSGSVINRSNVSATFPHTWASGDKILATLVVPI